MDPSAGADFGTGPSGRWPAGQEQSGMSIGGMPEQAAPPTGSQTGKHPGGEVAPSRFELAQFRLDVPLKVFINRQTADGNYCF